MSSSDYDTYQTKTIRDEIDLEDEPPQRVTTELILEESKKNPPKLKLSKNSKSKKFRIQERIGNIKRRSKK